jgi:hypothetical protein
VPGEAAPVRQDRDDAVDAVLDVADAQEGAGLAGLERGADGAGVEAVEPAGGVERGRVVVGLEAAAREPGGSGVMKQARKRMGEESLSMAWRSVTGIGSGAPAWEVRRTGPASSGPSSS